MSDLFMLSEKQFNRIKPYFPLSHGVPRVDDLRVITGKPAPSCVSWAIAHREEFYF